MSTQAAEQPDATQVGSYFISNYPPFSTWGPDDLDAVRSTLTSPPDVDTPLGLYIHIPFCRKRCKFCYFRVFTDKNAEDVERYLAAVTREVELYSQQPSIAQRSLRFAYFGGGTPSFLSAAQLESLVERITRLISWDAAREVTFECEPGTLQKHKLETIKRIGVTRLSLGVENFDDTVLEVNGRAHLSKEIFRAYGWARDVGFDQINIDLIAGMVGETDSNWQACVRKTIELAPESVTIYQMELPYNTVFSRETNGGSGAVADWPTKRAWVAFAFDALEQAGYRVSSGYTMVKDASDTRFEYRDSLWRGADMLGVGVASFSHLGGMHVQNLDAWEDYVTALSSGTLPLARALKPTPHQRLIREFILQLKFGRTDVAPLGEKFGVDVLETFSEPLRHWRDEGMLTVDRTVITLTRAGLLRVDGLLPAFFEPQHQGIRYT
jgi:oxygen-independent coproporphyrinogen-3 oxidase